MTSFEFNTPGRIIFGRGQINRLPELAAPFGSSALVVHAGERDSLAVRHVAILLAGKSFQLHFVRQSGEPKVSDVDAMAEVARREECESVIGVGGGSAIDAAKAVAGLLGNGGSALDYLEVVGKGRKIMRPVAPLIAIPTTAGTGAEATRNAVLTAGTFKASMRSDHLLPRIALVDPTLALEVPPSVIASSGMDALCQLIESYTSNNANNMTDALVRHGIRMAINNLQKSFTNPTDLDRREQMSFAALVSGMALTNAGLGAVHGFAAPLGAHFPIPHGVICARLLPAVIEANAAQLGKEDPLGNPLWKYVEAGRFTSRPELAKDEAIDALKLFTRKLLGHFKIPTLATFGLGEGDIAKMVELAKQSSSMKYNPVKLSDEALAGILRAGIEGYPDAK